jgi:hypothetical protein
MENKHIRIAITENNYIHFVKGHHRKNKMHRHIVVDGKVLCGHSRREIKCISNWIILFFLKNEILFLDAIIMFLYSCLKFLVGYTRRHSWHAFFKRLYRK